jgi:toxin CptA
MSIAVSAVIRPSRLLRFALSAYAAASAGAATLLVFGHAGRFHLPWLLALACTLAALAAVRAAASGETTRRIDISGLGEIRLTVQHSIGTRRSARELVRLLPGSTVWPQLLLLVLREPDSGKVTVLAILPDSVPPGQFRNIAVSVNAIARRDNKFFRKNKIL